MKALTEGARNWRTTLLGGLALAQALVVALIAYFDANPETVPDYQAVVTAAILFFGLLFARDASIQ